MQGVLIWRAHAEVQSWRELVLTGLVATGAMGLAPGAFEALGRALGA